MQKEIDSRLKGFGNIGIYFVLGAVLVAEVVLAGWLIPPKFTGLLNGWKELDAKTTEVNKLTEALSSVSKVDQTVVGQDLELVKAALPDEKKTSGIIAGLSLLASSSGIAISGLEFTPGLISTASGTVDTARAAPRVEIPLESGVKAIPANLSVIGSLGSITKFISDVQSSSQILGIESVGYRVSLLTGSSAEIAVLIYYQPLSQKPASPDQVSPISEADRKIIEGLPKEDIFTLRTE